MRHINVLPTIPKNLQKHLYFHGTTEKGKSTIMPELVSQLIGKEGGTLCFDKDTHIAVSETGTISLSGGNIVISSAKKGV